MSKQLHLSDQFFGGVVWVGADHAQEGVLVVDSLRVANHDLPSLDLLLFDFHDYFSQRRVVLLLLLFCLRLLATEYLGNVVVADVVENDVVAQDPSVTVLLDVVLEGLSIGIAVVRVFDDLIDSSALEVDPQLQNINVSSALESLVACIKRRGVVRPVLVEQVRSIH